MNELTINEQIAVLLQQQTFADRQAMAARFRDMVIDAGTNTPPDELDLDWFMHCFEYWAEAELVDDTASEVQP